jgi:steroid delta-isomerase-like uncharacterized protein
MTALETVKRYYAYFNDGDKEGMLALLDEQVRHEPNQGEPRTGKDLFRAFLDRMEVSYAEQLKDIVLFSSETEGRIAAEFTVHGTHKKAEEGMPPAHGQAYVLPAAAFLEVRNGLITRVTTYYNLELWLRLVS